MQVYNKEPIQVLWDMVKELKSQIPINKIILTNIKGIKPKTPPKFINICNSK